MVPAKIVLMVAVPVPTLIVPPPDVLNVSEPEEPIVYPLTLNVTFLAKTPPEVTFIVAGVPSKTASLTVPEAQLAVVGVVQPSGSVVHWALTPLAHVPTGVAPPRPH